MAHENQKFWLSVAFFLNYHGVSKHTFIVKKKNPKTKQLFFLSDFTVNSGGSENDTD